jgi:hypothetical protein
LRHDLHFFKGRTVNGKQNMRCPVGNVLRRIGYMPMLGDESAMCGKWYFLQTDRWYLERRIYVFVGINITTASILFLAWSAWWSLFTIFVGGAMVWFAASGFCVMANFLYWLGAEPRPNPQALPSARCAKCAMSPVCVSHPKCA